MRSGPEAGRGLPDSYEMPVSIVGVISGLPSTVLGCRRWLDLTPSIRVTQVLSSVSEVKTR
ncbi:hypothetical protein ASF21_09560 [Arthrobacter sp. Leaf234]|nr:hypothetical protein ASF21_09560 [Arthrobacter sp. Leaf234]